MRPHARPHGHALRKATTHANVRIAAALALNGLKVDFYRKAHGEDFVLLVLVGLRGRKEGLRCVRASASQCCVQCGAVRPAYLVNLGLLGRELEVVHKEGVEPQVAQLLLALRWNER